MAKKKLVVILYGGRSVEHGVSINSARNIATYIDSKKFAIQTIGIGTNGKWYLTAGVDRNIQKGSPLLVNLNPQDPYFLNLKTNQKIRPDIIFPVLHGTDGEDGAVQGMLQVLSIPMVGTAVLGSALAMNKITAKRLLEANELPVAPFIAFHVRDREKINYPALVRKFGLPFMVKAASLGSSVGVTKVKKKADFEPALESAFQYDDEVLIEQYITGREIECAVLGNTPAIASNPGEIVISDKYDFYTFDAKYVDPEAVKIKVPAELTKIQIEKVRSASVKAFNALHCKDFARIDLFLDSKGNIYINEINTIPGFTNSSMFPMMWKERGVEFPELITRLIDMALDRHAGQRTSTEFESDLKY